MISDTNNTLSTTTKSKVYSYTLKYSSHLLNARLKSSEKMYEELIRKLDLSTFTYLPRKGFVETKHDIARAFNNECPFSLFQKGDILFIHQLTDIALSPRDAVKKIERYSKIITIYICTISISKDYSYYRKDLLSFYGLNEDSCSKKAGPKIRRKKEISVAVRNAYKHYSNSETHAAMPFYEDKLGLSRSYIYKLFQRIREEEAT